MTAQTKRRFVRVLGYSGFFVACFMVALALTFPYETLTGYAERRASAALDRDVSIEAVRPTITGAIRLTGVTLGPKRGPAPQPEVPALQVEQATVRLGLFATLFGGTDVRFSAEVADGTVRGRYYRSREEVGLRVELEGVQARRLPVLRDKIGLPVKGTIEGEVDFTVPVGKANDSTGKIRLALSGFVIGDGEAKLSVGRLMGYDRGRRSSDDEEEEGLPVPALALGPVELQSTIANGEATIPRVTATSPDAEFSFEGQIKLREPLAQSRVDTYLTFKLTDAYTDRDDAVRDVMKLVDVYGRQAKRPDGAFGFRLAGTLGAGVSMRPSKSFALGGREPPGVREAGARRRPGRPQGFESGGDDEPLGPSPPPVPPRRRLPGEQDEGADEGQGLYPSGMPRPPISRLPRLRPHEEALQGDDGGNQQVGPPQQQERQVDPGGEEQRDYE